MLSLGYKEKKNIKTIDDVIQPKYVMRLNIKDHTEDSLIATFHSKTRYNISPYKTGIATAIGVPSCSAINIFTCSFPKQSYSWKKLV